jgi:hypothetical protein
MRHSNTRLCIYRMGDAPAFMIKGNTCALVMGDGMRDAPSFVIKGDALLAKRTSPLQTERVNQIMEDMLRACALQYGRS